MGYESLGGGGFDYVQSTAPADPDAGETWFDTSVNNGAGKIYADLGSGSQWHTFPTQKELAEGRTRELLLLLQDNPIPEVQDPINFQSSLSNTVTTDDNENYIISLSSTTALLNSSGSEGFSITDGGVVFNPNAELKKLEFTVSSGSPESVDNVRILKVSDSTEIESFGTVAAGEKATSNKTFSSGVDYALVGDTQDDGQDFSSDRFPATSTNVDIVGGWSGGTSGEGYHFQSVTGYAEANNGYVTDEYTAPTTAPGDFKQWNAIRAEDVTAGGSTSPTPVEFDILDSSDAAVNSARIPASEIADSPFSLRDREWSASASAGQSEFVIPETGAGGHYGIPVLSVATVERNGSVLDPDTWEFDSTDTVTLDNGASDGDAITVSYDFDVFNSTLQPRAHLSRESASEASPSISHFRYEYVV